MHSHADRAFASDNIDGRRAHNLVMQGITTSVFGPDGRNPVWPIPDEMEAYRTRAWPRTWCRWWVTVPCGVW